MITVWFIRHAESESNAGLPTQDPASTKITAKGQQQASQIALSLPQAPALVVTSPYLRTKQTAEPTLERFPEALQSEWPVQEFTFLAPAQYHNTTVYQRRPLVNVYWQRCDPFYIDGEGAESFAGLVQRVQQVRSQIAQLEDELAAKSQDKSEDKLVVIFSHGRFIRAMLWLLLTNPIDINARTMRQFQHFSDALQVPNGAILKVQFRDSEFWISYLILSHLKGRGMGSDPEVEP